MVFTFKVQCDTWKGFDRKHEALSLNINWTCWFNPTLSETPSTSFLASQPNYNLIVTKGNISAMNPMKVLCECSCFIEFIKRVGEKR